MNSIEHFILASFLKIQEGVQDLDSATNSIDDYMPQGGFYLEEKDDHLVIKIIGGIAVVLLIIIAFGFNWYQRKYWAKGVFPIWHSFNQKNYVEAFVHIGMNLSLRNMNEYGEKQRMINEYVRQKYPNEGSLKHTMKSAMHDKVSTESLGLWFAKHLNEDERISVLQFYIGLAFADGDIGVNELRELQILMDAFQLDKTRFLNEIQEKRRENAEYSERRRQSIPKSTSNYKQSQFLAIFGFETMPDEDELKKAYRKLVKEVHPDSHPDASESELDEFKIRFQEIQDAYEYLC